MKEIEIYEVVAQGARYWFLLLMALIVWRSWRWYRKDKRQAKKRMKLLPDAGFVGEMVVVEGDETLKRGAALAVPTEGTLGSLRTNDLSLPGQGVAKRHLWFRFDEDKGLLVEPFGKNAASVDGTACRAQKGPLYMGHGSRLRVGAYELRLRLFAGFECAAPAYAGEPREAQLMPDAPQEPQPQAAMQQALWQQQWMLQQQQAYAQGYEQALRQLRAAEAPDEAPDEAPEMVWDDDAYAAMEQSAYAQPTEAAVRETRASAEPEPEACAAAETFYPPVMDETPDEADWGGMPDPDAGVTVYDEDMTDAAAPPKSAYVGHDDAETAKKRVWDRYFGGGVSR